MINVDDVISTLQHGKDVTIYARDFSYLELYTFTKYVSFRHQLTIKMVNHNLDKDTLPELLTDAPKQLVLFDYANE